MNHDKLTRQTFLTKPEVSILDQCYFLRIPRFYSLTNLWLSSRDVAFDVKFFFLHLVLRSSFFPLNFHFYPLNFHFYPLNFHFYFLPLIVRFFVFFLFSNFHLTPLELSFLLYLCSLNSKNFHVLSRASVGASRAFSGSPGFTMWPWPVRRCTRLHAILIFLIHGGAPL